MAKARSGHAAPKAANVPKLPSARKPFSWAKPGLLGAAAYALLPMVDLEPLIGASLPARAILAACVVGLLRTPTRPRWAVSATAVAAVLAGWVVLGLLDGRYFSPVGLAIGMPLAAILSLGIASLASAFRPRAAEVTCVALVLLVALWFAGFLPGPLQQQLSPVRQSKLSSVPQTGQYAFDGDDFMRTYSLMKQGVGYFPAFRQSVTEDTRHNASYMQTPFNYREPLIFEIWRLLPGSTGNDLLTWFVVWSLGTMIAAYMLASALTEPGVALLAPVALIRFFLFFWWQGAWFTVTEVWAAAFGVAAIAALVRKQRIASLLLLVAAVAAREFFVVLIPAWIVVWWLSGENDRRASWWFPVAAVAGPLAVLASHVVFSQPYLTPGAGVGLSAWLHGGPARLIAALRFGWSPQLSATGLPEATWLPLAIAAGAIVSAAIARPKWRAAALLCATLLPTLFLLSVSGGESHYYWGAFYTPLAVAIAPGVLARFMPPWTTS